MTSFDGLLICLWALFHSSNATCNGNLSACEAPSTTANDYGDPCAASTVFKSTTVWHTQTDYRTETCWSTATDTSTSVSTVTKTETTSSLNYLTSTVTVPGTTTETKTSISTQSTTIVKTTTVTQTITATAEVTSTATDTSVFSETVTITLGTTARSTETYTKTFTSIPSCEPPDATTSPFTVTSISTSTTSVISTETMFLTVTANTSCLPSDNLTRTVTETLITSSVSTKSITTGAPAVTVTQPATVSATMTETMTVPVRITATVTATATVLRTISSKSMATNQLTVYATTTVLQVSTVVVELTRISTTSVAGIGISYAPISRSDSPMTTSTDLEALVTCPTRAAILDVTAQAAIPKNYTWGCPPGRLCQPRQENCNFEQNDPDPDYRCSPDECVEPPPITELGTSENLIDYACGRLYKPLTGYFNLDPRPFGLGFWIFDVHGQQPRPCPAAACTSSGWRDWHTKGSTAGTKLQQRQSDMQVPPLCYEPCNYCNIVAQSTGKSEQALCPDTSPFQTNLSQCRKCIKSGKNGAKPDEVPPLLHELQQWIEFCASAAPMNENTAVSAQTGQRTTNTERPSQPNNVTASAEAQSPRAEATSAGVFVGLTNSTSPTAKTSAEEAPISTPVDEEGSPSKDSLAVADTAQSLEQSQLSSNTSNFPAPTNASATTLSSDDGLAGASSSAAPAVTAGVASPYTGAGSESCPGTRGAWVLICLAVLSVIVL